MLFEVPYHLSHPYPSSPPIPALTFFHFVPWISCCSLNSGNGDQPQDICQSCDFLSGQLFPRKVPVLTPPCSFFFRASLTCDFQRPLQPFCFKSCKHTSPSLCSFLVLFCIVFQIAQHFVLFSFTFLPFSPTILQLHEQRLLLVLLMDLFPMLEKMALQTGGMFIHIFTKSMIPLLPPVISQ